MAKATHILSKVSAAATAGFVAARRAVRSGAAVGSSIARGGYGWIGGRGDGWRRTDYAAPASYSDPVDRAESRDRARNLDDYNGIAHSVLNTEVDFVIGTGLRAVFDTGDDAFDEQATQYVNERMAEGDGSGTWRGGELQRNLYRYARRDGNAGSLLYKRPGTNLRSVQVLYDESVAYRSGERPRDPRYRLDDGILIGAEGRPLRYFVRTVNQHGTEEYTPVAARNVLWLANGARPGQPRGHTCFRPAFRDINDASRYLKGVSDAAWLATWLGLIFKRANPAAASRLPGATPLGATPDANGDVERSAYFDGTGLHVMGQGDEVVQVNAKQPLSHTPEFTRLLLRIIGLSLDMPLEVAAKDYSGANFSVSRLIMGAYQRAVEPKRMWFAAHYLIPYTRWIVYGGIKDGDLVVPERPQSERRGIAGRPMPFNPVRHRWQGDPALESDPVKNTLGILAQMDAGLIDLYTAAAMLGRDADEIADWQATAMARRRKLGLPEVRSSNTRDPNQPPPEAEEDDDDGEDDQ